MFGLASLLLLGSFSLGRLSQLRLPLRVFALELLLLVLHTAKWLGISTGAGQQAYHVVQLGVARIP